MSSLCVRNRVMYAWKYAGKPHPLLMCTLSCKSWIIVPLKMNVILYAIKYVHNNILKLLVAIPKRDMSKHWNNYHLTKGSVVIFIKDTRSREYTSCCEYFRQNVSCGKLHECHSSCQTLFKTLLILIKCRLNYTYNYIYIYAKYQVYLIILCLIMPKSKEALC